MNTVSTVNALAQFALSTGYQNLPPDVVAETKRILLDSIGCAVAGTRSEKGRWGLDYARSCLAGPAQASVIGLDERLSIAGAAFVNAEAINGHDFDAGMTPGHVTPFVLPAILAVAESRASTGRQLLTASAVAHEISHRVGANLGTFREIVNGQVRFPLVSGYSFTVFGGVAGIAMLEGFSVEQIRSALGLAGHMAPMQAHTTMMKNLPTTTAKYLMAGWMAQAQIAAAYLARAGHVGDTNIMNDEWGYWRFAGAARWDAASVLDALGTRWKFQETARYKIYPCCRIMHGALDLLASIIAEHRLVSAEIESIHALLESSCTEPVFSTREIRTQVDAQFSIAYNLAVMAAGIAPGIRWQEQSTIESPEVQALMRKITFAPHPQYIAKLRDNAQVRITGLEVTARGTVFRGEKEIAKGAPSRDPSTYMTDADIALKFRQNVARTVVSDRAQDITDMVMSLEQLKDTAELLRLLQGTAVAR